MLHKRSLLLFQLPAARRHFLNTLATYLLVVALSAFAFWPMAHTMRDAVQSARLDARKGNSTAALAHLERQIQTIQDAFLYLSSQKGFDRVSLIRAEVEPRDYIAMIDARDFLASIRGANSLIEDILVSYEHNDIVLTARFVFDSRASFADYYGNEALLHMLTRSPEEPQYAQPAMLTETELHLPSITPQGCRVLPYYFPIFSRSNPVKPYGCVVVLLNCEQIESILFPAAAQNSERFEILDSAGNHLSGDLALLRVPENNPIAIGDMRYTWFSIAGKTLSLRIAVPSAVFAEYAQPVLKVLARYLLVGLALGVAASMVSAARVTRPVRKILLELRESGAALDRDRNAYALIVQSMGAILEKANRLDAVTQAAHDERQNRQIERLISGWSTDLQIEGIPQQSTLCYTLFQANNAQPNATLGPLLTNYMRRLLPRDCIVQLLDAESLCILSACESETEREAFANQMERLFSEMGTLFGAEIHGFISPLCLRPEEISCAFAAAKLASYAQQDAAPSLVRIIPKSEATNLSLTIPGQTELLHMLLAGKEDEACQFIQRSFRASGGPNVGMEQIYYAVRLVILMAMQQQNLSFPLSLYHSGLAPEENIEALIQAASQLCQALNEGKRSHNEQLLAQILAYIDAHFSDAGLYHATLAQAIGISEKYLSNFVKEQTGRTVSDLLQTRRLESARDLLLHTTKPVNDIWLSCGFASHNTFYKAFKRAYGLSPSELRALGGQ